MCGWCVCGALGQSPLQAVEPLAVRPGLLPVVVYGAQQVGAVFRVTRLELIESSAQALIRLLDRGEELFVDRPLLQGEGPHQLQQDAPKGGECPAEGGARSCRLWGGRYAVCKRVRIEPRLAVHVWLTRVRSCAKPRSDTADTIRHRPSCGLWGMVSAEVFRRTPAAFAGLPLVLEDVAHQACGVPDVGLGPLADGRVRPGVVADGP